MANNESLKAALRDLYRRRAITYEQLQDSWRKEFNEEPDIKGSAPATTQPTSQPSAPSAVIRTATTPKDGFFDDGKLAQVEALTGSKVEITHNMPDGNQLAAANRVTARRVPISKALLDVLDANNREKLRERMAKNGGQIETANRKLISLLTQVVTLTPEEFKTRAAELVKGLETEELATGDTLTIERFVIEEGGPTVYDTGRE